jgi:hypothetical protein
MRVFFQAHTHLKSIRTINTLKRQKKDESAAKKGYEGLARVVLPAACGGVRDRYLGVSWFCSGRSANATKSNPSLS